LGTSVSREQDSLSSSWPAPKYSITSSSSFLKGSSSFFLALSSATFATIAQTSSSVKSSFFLFAKISPIF